MASLPHGSVNCGILLGKRANSYVGFSDFPFLQSGGRACRGFMRGRVISQCLYEKKAFALPEKRPNSNFSKKKRFSVSSGSNDDPSDQKEKIPFGYTRKDVLLIGVGVTVLGFGLKNGLELVGFDSLQSGNVVQLVIVLGLTVGWISTYIFRVANKDMTYAQQLRDYENKVMEKRLEGLTEAEIEALLEQVEEEKRRLASGEQVQETLKDRIKVLWSVKSSRVLKGYPPHAIARHVFNNVGI